MGLHGPPIRPTQDLSYRMIMTPPTSPAPPANPPAAELRRILFVDDDQSVLAALRNLLRKQRGIWEMRFALGGHAALEAFAEGPFDVVVSDMRMPGMDGTELLTAIRESSPSTARIVLSGYAGPEAIAGAMTVAHQFLAKPCEPKLLTNVVAQVCTLQSLLGNQELRSIVGRVDRLPSVPKLYNDLVEALGRPSVRIAEIAELICAEPAMAAKILQLVNSSYFGMAQPVSSIERAVLHLGSDVIRSLALTVGIFARMGTVACPGFSSAALQERALLGARLARDFLSADPVRASDAFAAALMRDVGVLVLVLGSSARYGEVLAAARAPDADLLSLERAAFGATHAEVGAYLLGLWGLPAALVEAVTYQHEPLRRELADAQVVLAVHVATELVDAAVAGRAVKLAPTVVEALGDRLPTWRRQADGLLRGAGLSLLA